MITDRPGFGRFQFRAGRTMVAGTFHRHPLSLKSPVVWRPVLVRRSRWDTQTPLSRGAATAAEQRDSGARFLVRFRWREFSWGSAGCVLRNAERSEKA